MFKENKTSILLVLALTLFLFLQKSYAIVDITINSPQSRTYLFRETIYNFSVKTTKENSTLCTFLTFINSSIENETKSIYYNISFENLTAYFTFDNVASDGRIYSINNTYNFTFNNSIHQLAFSPKYKGLLFNGTTTISVPSASDNVTFSFFIKNGTTTFYFVSYFGSSSINRLHFNPSTKTITICLGTTSYTNAYICVATVSIPELYDSNWHHLVVNIQKQFNYNYTYSITLYFDGNLYYSGSSSTSESFRFDTPTVLALELPSSSRWGIDDLMIFSRNLTQNEIQKLALYSRLMNGLVAYWKFDEGSDNITYDSSGYGNNGTYYGYNPHTQSNSTLLRLTGSSPINLTHNFLLPEKAILSDVNLTVSYRNNTAISGYNTIRVFVNGNYIGSFNDSGENSIVNYTFVNISKNYFVAGALNTITYEGNVTNITQSTLKYVQDIGWQDGKYGKALSFDGVDDYVEVSSSSSLTIPERTELTVVAWVKRAGLGVYQTIASLGGWGRDGWTFRVEDNNRLMFVARFTDGTGSGEIEAGYVDTEWRFVSVVYDGYINLYIDGVLVYKSNYFGKTIAGRDFPLRIGCLDIKRDFFNGLIDEVRIYNRALSEEEIKALYNLRILSNQSSLSYNAYNVSHIDTNVFYVECHEQNATSFNLVNFSIANLCLNAYYSNMTETSARFFIFNTTHQYNDTFSSKCFKFYEIPQGNVTIQSQLNYDNFFIDRVRFTFLNNTSSYNYSFFFSETRPSCFVFEVRDFLNRIVRNALVSFYHQVNGVFTFITSSYTDSSGQVVACLPEGMPIRIEVIKEGYLPLNTTRTLYSWTSQPLTLILLPPSIEDVTKERFRIFAIFEPSDYVVNTSTQVRVSIIASETTTLSGVLFEVYNATYTSNFTLFSSSCTNQTICVFSYSLNYPVHHYVLKINVNMSDGGETKTINYVKSYYTTATGNVLLSGDIVSGSDVSRTVWLFIWFILTTAVSILSFKASGLSGLFVMSFMLFFGVWLSILTFGEALLIFIFILIFMIAAG